MEGARIVTAHPSAYLRPGETATMAVLEERSRAHGEVRRPPSSWPIAVPAFGLVPAAVFSAVCVPSFPSLRPYRCRALISTM